MRKSPTTPSLILVLCAVLLLLCLSNVPGRAERKSIKQYVHQIWTSSEGLPQNSAASILQTRDGYIWFGTQEGLARFDGHEFTVFDRASTKELPSSWIMRLMEDSAGGLWARVRGFAPGIVRYYQGNFVHYDTADGLPHGRVISWVTGAQGTTWLGTLGGVAEFGNGKFKAYRVSNGLPSDTVSWLGLDSRSNVWISTTRGLARLAGGKIEVMTGQKDYPDTVFLRVNAGSNCFEDRNGTVWMNTAKTLYAIRDGNVTRYDKKTVLTNSTIQVMYEDARGILWIGTALGLNSFTDGKFKKYNISSDPQENNINIIKEDREGSLWLATGAGIARLADGKIERYQQKDGLSDDGVQDMLIDKEGNVWVSTFGGGVDRFRDEKFVTYSSKMGLSYDNVEAVLQDHTGALWIGGSFGALNRLSNGLITHYEPKAGPPFVELRTLAEDKDGTIWIGANSGVYTLKNGVIKTLSHLVNNQPDISSGAFLQTKSGEWLMGNWNQLATYRGGKLVPLASIGTKENVADFVSALFEDSRGTIWVSTIGALYRYSNGRLEKVGPETGYKGSWAMAYHEDADGTLWIGSGGDGIYRYRDGKFISISPRQGLFDYNVYNVLDDGLGYIWMSSNRGVFRTSKQQLNDVADGKSQSVVCTVYGVADGMESRECNGGYFPAGFKLQDGRLCFASVKGVVIVNPADIKINQVPPPVVIDQFLVEGERQPMTGVVTVPPGKTRFEFHYAGISFAGSKEVRYKYQLEGMDEGWIDAGSRREAFYTHLNPGKYTFKVLAANSDGIWNETGARASFELKPYFYQTAWFMGLIAVGFLTTGPTFYFRRMRQMKKRKEELEHLVQERTGELQKTLNNLKDTQNQLILSEKMASLGQLTAGIAHEIKNPLNFITNFAVLSQDLTQDLRKELAAERDRVDPKRAQEIEELLNDLEQNVTKINDHGKRADSIVRGMLLHSRGKSGERQETDLNALLAEYTNLAYHGMRAQDHTFNVKIETDFDPAVGKVSVVPQDLSRAFLNIVNNACYAANDKKKSVKDGFSPTVRVSAKSFPGCVEIRIRDNGNGIPAAIREKVFNPFFTTKPPGSGTGLGLSLSYDIITQEHKGEIRVDTKEGEYTEFVITIPRNIGNGKEAA